MKFLYSTIQIAQSRAISLLSEYYTHVKTYGIGCESNKLELVLKEMPGVNSEVRNSLFSILQDMERLSLEVQQ